MQVPRQRVESEQLQEARDGTRNFVVPSRIHFRYVITPTLVFNTRSSLGLLIHLSYFWGRELGSASMENRVTHPQIHTYIYLWCLVHWFSTFTT